MTIRNIDDLVRIVRQDSDARDTLRRELLTQDLIEVPGRIDNMLATQNEILREQKLLREETNTLREDTNALRETQNTILETLASVLSGMSTIEEAVQQSRAETKADIEEAVRPIRDTMDRFRSNYAVEAAIRDGLGIVRPFARHRGIRRAKFTIVDPDVVDAMIDGHDEELEKLDFSDDDIESVRQADLVFEVARRTASSPSFYVLAEVSYTGDFDDLDRACKRARILSVVTGLDVYPVVPAVALDPSRGRGRIIEDFEEFIAMHDGELAYWYKLDDEDVQPPHSR